MTEIKYIPGSVVIVTDEPDLKCLFEYTYLDKKYDTRLKHLVDGEVKGHIWSKISTKSGKKYIQLGLGWIPYLLMVLPGRISGEAYDELAKSIYSQDTLRMIPFKELKDFQNDDVLHLLRYKRGLYTVYTGYGKTQVISVLTNYLASVRHMKILILTPGAKACDELLKRLKSLYGIEIKRGLQPGNQIQAILSTGFLNQKIVKDPELERITRAELQSFDVLLADEVEYAALNPSGKYILENVSVGAKIMYGFSGTAEKQNGGVLSLTGGITPEIAKSSQMIGFFGPSLIYRKPSGKIVNMIDIKSTGMNNVETPDFRGSSNIYLDTMMSILTSPGVCRDIVKVCKLYPLIFVPINNLTSIINHWIENYFSGVFRVLLVCFEGYIYYDITGARRKLSGLEEAVDLIKGGEVDVIPSTTSGFKALDLPGLENILLISGNIASSALQQVGRCARGNTMNILTMSPASGRKLPIYSKGIGIRDEMIRDYYENCIIKKFEYKL